MKFVILFLGVFTAVMCARPYDNMDDHHHHQYASNHFNNHNKYNDKSQDAKILQQDYINAGNGYNFLYQTSDGVQREEKAELRNPGTKEETLVVHGSYSYVGADGVTYTITYVADENGYRPTGQHIPSL